MDKVIYKYIKGKGRFSNTNVAILMGSVHKDGILITSSKANVVAGDVFDKERARRIGVARINKYRMMDEVTPIPKSLVPEVVKFEERCERYFKCQLHINHMYPN